MPDGLNSIGHLDILPRFSYIGDAFMFYQFSDDVTTVDVDNIDCHYVTAGYVTVSELEKIYEGFGFSRTTLDTLNNDDFYSRFGVEMYDDYCFTKLSVLNTEEVNGEKDIIAIYIKKNLFIVVDVKDNDCSTRDTFLFSLNKYSSINITLEKLIYSFMDSLTSRDYKIMADKGLEITQLEEIVLKDRAKDNFNFELLQMKKDILAMRNYYEQLIDIGEALEDNENEIFDENYLRYISNFTNKAIRLRDDMELLRGSVVHLQDAYQSYIDLKLNHTMQIFTTVTTVFFPLTLIVGWYGMNFKYMPELAWKYGYVFVIVLSFAVVAVLAVIVKKKKWIG